MSRALIAVLVGAVLAPVLHAQETVFGGEERQSVALTLYGTGPGLVQETRRVFLAPGEVALSLAGVSAGIQAETLRVAVPEGVEVRSQGLELSPLSRHTLLERHLGRSITVARIDPATGTEHRESATLLSAEGDTAVFRVGGGIEVEGPNSPWRLIFGDLAGEVGPRPALALDLKIPEAGEHALALTYLSEGLSWETHYVATLSPDGEALDLLAWAALRNTSGVDYLDARVQLVAGDVNRASPPAQALRGAAMEALAVSPAAQDTAFEYHLYTLEHPVSLVHPQTRLVPLLAAPGIAVGRTYRVSAPTFHYGLLPGPQVLPVRTVLRLEAPAGQPLPGGVIRFYQTAGTGGEIFLGEDRLAPTPAGGEAELEVGTSFDLQARRRQLEFRRLSQDLVETSWEIVLHNARPGPATVDVVETLGGDWRIIEESHPHERETAQQLRWQVEVPARGEARLRYRVQVR